MAAYAQDFQSKSQGLLGYVQSQLSQAVGWRGLPGQLNKIVASSGGYVWGFNSVGDFYTCKEPCDGTNWKQVSRPSRITGMPLDIAVDAQNVYVLFNATAAPQETVNTTPGIQTGLINIGDVGMPPGHISAGNGSVVVSATFLGPNAGAVAAAITKGSVYTATIKDEKGVTVTFPITSVGTNPSWQGPPWVYGYGGSGGDSASVAAKFAKSKRLALTLTGPAAVSSSPPIRSSGLSFAMRPVDGSGNWSTPKPIPGDVPVTPQINITDQFIFVGNQGCSKPCTTSSWVPISAPQGGGQSLGVYAASSGSTYIPVNNAGRIKVYAGTSTGQGGWTEKPGLSGKIPVAVEADNQFMYAQDQGSGSIYRCGAPYTEADSCKLADTQGNTVTGNHTISVNPRSFQTYLAASSSGPVGNLYQRLDEGSVNVAPLIEQTKKYTSGLDSDVNSLGYAAYAQASALSAAHTRQQAMEAIEEITDLDDKFTETRIKQGNMRSKIVNEKSVLSTRIMALKVVAYTLIAVIILHIALSFFLSPTIVMSISVAAALIGVTIAYSYLGVGYSISFSSLN